MKHLIQELNEIAVERDALLAFYPRRHLAGDFSLDRQLADLDDRHDTLTKALLKALAEIPAVADAHSERSRQNEKWGEQNHDNPTWALIAGEEFGEVQQAILHDRFGGRAAGTTRTELVQLTAVCFQWLECIDRNSPKDAI